MSTRIRTAIITLIAASSFALASVPLTPVASAAKNTSIYAKTTAHRFGNVNWYVGTCEEAQNTFTSFSEMAGVDLKEGNLKAALTDASAAMKTAELAKNSGCSIS